MQSKEERAADSRSRASTEENEADSNGQTSNNLDSDIGDQEQLFKVTGLKPSPGKMNNNNEVNPDLNKSEDHITTNESLRALLNQEILDKVLNVNATEPKHNPNTIFPGASDPHFNSPLHNSKKEAAEGEKVENKKSNTSNKHDAEEKRERGKCCAIF